MKYLSFSKISKSVKRSFAYRRMRGAKGLKASITIYLSLMLIIITALICTLIESGRVSAVNARLRSITYMAADSVFSEFAQPVFDRFGVMGLWADEKEFLEKFDAYVSANLDLAGTGAGADMDLYGMQYAGSSLSDITWLTDKDAKAFADQVFDYMKIHAAEGLAEDLISRTEYFEKTKKARAVLEKVNAYERELIQAEEGASEIYDRAQQIKDLSENPKTLFEEMEKALDGYRAGDETQAAVFRDKRNELAQKRTEISWETDRMEEESGTYLEERSGEEDTFVEIQEELKLNEEDYDPALYQVLKQKVSDVTEAAGETGNAYQKVTRKRETAQAYRNQLNDLDNFFAGTEQELTAENLESYQILTDQYKGEFDSTDLSVLEGEPDNAGDISARAGFIVTVSNRYQFGLLDWLAGDISQKQIDQSSFPSKTSAKEKSGDNGEEFVDKTTQKALFSEYVVEHFGNFTDMKADTAMDYEVEYVLGGKNTDRENLSSVVTQLVFLRLGVNLVSLYLDNEKMAEIRGLAMAIASASTQVYIEKAVEGVITFIWALAESMLEVKTLLAGNRVVVLKKNGDWFLSLEGLQNFSGEEGIGQDRPDGLSYKDYLRILLLLENQRDQRYRTLDMIQADMCVTENENFRVKDCMTGICAEAEFSAPGVFAGIPLVSRTVGIENNGYQFRFQQEYAY